MWWGRMKDKENAWPAARRAQQKNASGVLTYTQWEGRHQTPKPARPSAAHNELWLPSAEGGFSPAGDTVIQPPCVAFT